MHGAFEAKDLQNLEVGEAVCRVEWAEFDFNLKTALLPAIVPETAEKQREHVIALSRKRYATPREVVQAAQRPAEAAPEPASPVVEKMPKLKPSPPASPTQTEVPAAPPSPGRGGPSTSISRS